MVGYATVMIQGQVAKDPELRYSPGDGVPCVTLCVKIVRANGYGRSTTFIEVKKSGNGAEALAAELKQGDVVRIEGNLVQRRWQHCGQDFSKLIVDAASVEKS